MTSNNTKITSFFTPKAAPPKPMEDPKEASPDHPKATEQSTTISPKEEPTPTTSGTPNPQATSPQTLHLTYHIGDLFAAPPNTLLIHACNTQGSWGAGIAAAFRTRYPKAYKRYREYCLVAHDPITNPIPTGTCLLIPPCETKPGAPKHWIGCLFTSARFGKKRDSPDQILRVTGPAMRGLLKDVKERGGVDQVRMCKINSGLFAVEWERTAEVLKGIVVEEDGKGEVEVWSIDDE